MNIVQLVIGGDLAGGQVVALQIARAARRRGDHVVFVSPTRGRFTELVEREGMEVHVVDISRLHRLGGFFGLVRLLRSVHADVLHTHSAVASNVLARLAGRAAGVPVVSHLHIENHFRPNPVARTLYATLDNATARLAARVLAVSAATRGALVAQGYPAERIEVVPNGIDIAAESAKKGGSLRVELGIHDGAPLVGELARLCDVKGQRELIDAAALLPGVHVVFAGEDLEQAGAYRLLLERRARERGVADRVHFLGYRADAGAVLDQLDVLVLPSWVEGMPIVVLEAMAHAKPVVATPVGGTAELVADGETGLLVPPRDPKRLATAIGALVADHGLAERLGGAGRRRVEAEFSEARMVGRVLSIYAAVVRA